MSEKIVIKHVPEGTGPYENKDYQRWPSHPAEGDIVIIKTVITSCCDTSNILLQWSKNGLPQPAVRPETKQRATSEEICCQFSVGSFRAGDYVSYYIEAHFKNSVIKTGEYFFSLPYSYDIFKAESLWFNGNSVLVEFEKPGNIKPVMKFYFEKGYLRVTLDVDDIKKESSYSKIEAPYFELVDDISSCSLYITLDKFVFEVRKRNGAALFRSWDDNENYSSFIKLQADSGGKAKSLSLRFNTDSKAFYGFGERYNHLNQAGLNPDVYVFEKFGKQENKTYMPIPFFLTENEYGIFIDSSQYIKYNLPSGSGNILEITKNASEREAAFDMYVFFGSPKSIITAYSRVAGLPVLPPKWAFGPWMSSNGWNTQKEALEQIEYAKSLNAPATVMVLEAWSDEATFYIFNEAEYKLKKGNEHFRYSDFKFNDSGKWPDPKKMIDYIHENGIRLVLWQIPVIKYFDYCENPQHILDEEYVIEKQFCVLNEDGSPYRIPDNWFFNSLVMDFTNPEARQWWFDKRRYLLEDLGVDGFKTDGGEFIYDSSACFYSGKKGTEMRNLYPLSYISAYHDFIGDDRITFSRAGFTGGQKYPMYWAGDQFSTFEEFKNVINAGLSINLSGNPFWGYDIAGFAGEIPSEELYIRSLQTAVFCPVMQFHSEPRSGFNNDRSPWNVSRVIGSNTPEVVYRKFANLRMNLLPYIYEEAAYVSKTGEPFMRPLFVDFPLDKTVYTVEDEYMFGRSLLVAPVMYSGVRERVVYLPEGQWIDFWSNEYYEGNSYIRYECDTDIIPVFVKSGSIIPMNLNADFEMGGSIGNRLDEYCKLSFLIYGTLKEPYRFIDDLGNNILIENKDNLIEVNFTGPAGSIYLLSMDKLNFKDIQDAFDIKNKVFTVCKIKEISSY